MTPPDADYKPIFKFSKLVSLFLPLSSIETGGALRPWTISSRPFHKVHCRFRLKLRSCRGAQDAQIQAVVEEGRGYLLGGPQVPIDKNRPICRHQMHEEPIREHRSGIQVGRVTLIYTEYKPKPSSIICDFIFYLELTTRHIMFNSSICHALDFTWILVKPVCVTHRAH